MITVDAWKFAESLRKKKLVEVMCSDADFLSLSNIVCWNDGTTRCQLLSTVKHQVVNLSYFLSYKDYSKCDFGFDKYRTITSVCHSICQLSVIVNAFGLRQC